MILKRHRNPEGCLPGCHHPAECLTGCKCFDCVQYDNYIEAGWPEIDSVELDAWAMANGLVGRGAPLVPPPNPHQLSR